MEAIHSSETSVYTRSTRRHTPGDGIIPSHRRENLKSHNGTGPSGSIEGEEEFLENLSDQQLLKKNSTERPSYTRV
jgi:hypothetical protein